MDKPCKICQTIDPLRYRTSSYCRKCHIKVVRDRQKLKKQKRTEKYKELMAELKSKPCVDCGTKHHPAVMEFDHLPQFEKTHAISKMSNRSLDSVRKEIEKCELVCANCHRYRTVKRMKENQ
jgi:hypothetical protein